MRITSLIISFNSLLFASETCLFCLILYQPTSILESWFLKIRKVLRLVLCGYIYKHLFLAYPCNGINHSHSNPVQLYLISISGFSV